MLNDRIWGSGSGVITITDGDTTPDVSGGITFETSNSASTTITAFGNAIGDKVITIIAGDNNTTIACNANIILEGGNDDFDMITNDALRLILRSDGVWIEKSRSMNSQKLVLNFDSQYDAEAASNTINDIEGEDFCFSCWIRISERMKGVTRPVFGKYGVSEGRFYVLYIVGLHNQPYCNVQFYMTDMGLGYWFSIYANPDDVPGGSTIADGQWHHIAVVIDRSHPDNDHCKLYIDAEDRGMIIDSDIPDSVANTGTFGMGTLGGSYSYDGHACDLKFLLGSLWTEEQIEYQYLHPFDYSASAGTITEYWRCDEGEGLILNGSNGHDLTLSDVAAWKGKWPDV